MNKLTKTIAAGMIAVSGLAGCSLINNISDLNSLLSSAAGQAVLAALGVGGSLIPGIQAVITNVDNGIANNTAALNTVCYALPWANGAVDFFGASVGIPVATVTEIDAAVAAFRAGPCTTPPTNLAQVISEGASLFIAIENDLNNRGVPVAVPATTTVVSTTFTPTYTSRQLNPN